MIIAGVLIRAEDGEKLRKRGVRDSKVLSPARRETLAKKIKKLALEARVVEVSAEDIDAYRKRMSLNELEALKIAELFDSFKHKPAVLIVDAPDPTASRFLRRVKKYARVSCKTIFEHKADVKYPAVSAASIIAKVARDARVREIEKENGIVVGTGYPHDPLTVKFLEECAAQGKCPDFVRKSWLTTQNLFEAKKQRRISDWG